MSITHSCKQDDFSARVSLVRGDVDMIYWHIKLPHVDANFATEIEPQHSADWISAAEGEQTVTIGEGDKSILISYDDVDYIFDMLMGPSRLAIRAPIKHLRPVLRSVLDEYEAMLIVEDAFNDIRDVLSGMGSGKN